MSIHLSGVESFQLRLVVGFLGNFVHMGFPDVSGWGDRRQLCRSGRLELFIMNSYPGSCWRHSWVHTHHRQSETGWWVWLVSRCRADYTYFGLAFAGRRVREPGRRKGALLRHAHWSRKTKRKPQVEQTRFFAPWFLWYTVNNIVKKLSK